MSDAIKGTQRQSQAHLVKVRTLSELEGEQRLLRLFGPTVLDTALDGHSEIMSESALEGLTEGGAASKLTQRPTRLRSSHELGLCRRCRLLQRACRRGVLKLTLGFGTKERLERRLRRGEHFALELHRGGVCERRAQCVRPRDPDGMRCARRVEHLRLGARARVQQLHVACMQRIRAHLRCMHQILGCAERRGALRRVAEFRQRRPGLELRHVRMGQLVELCNCRVVPASIRKQARLDPNASTQRALSG